jgi:NUMOD4 motif
MAKTTSRKRNADMAAAVMTDEIWRPVPGWDGYYSVSNRGRVRSEPRYVQRRTTRLRVRGRILRPSKIGSVNLSKPGARRSALSHTLAAEAFGCGVTAA